MQIGAFIFPTEYSIRIDELARALEERGLESLFVTEHTAKYHVSSLFNKLGVTTRAEAVARAVALGLLTPGDH